MDQNLESVIEKRALRTMENLKKNRMSSCFVRTREELLKKLSELVCPGATVSVGGSRTLFETGAIDFLRSGAFNFLDRYADGLSPEDIRRLYRRTFSADFFLVSTNAVTEKGELFNVDGIGNRVAAMIYGPEKVIVIAGTNKIVRDIREAEIRLRETAAPANTCRLNRDTPCRETGTCMDCSSPDRICNSYVTIKKQAFADRIHVILIKGDYGY